MDTDRRDQAIGASICAAILLVLGACMPLPWAFIPLVPGVGVTIAAALLWEQG